LKKPLSIVADAPSTAPANDTSDNRTDSHDSTSTSGRPPSLPPPPAPSSVDPSPPPPPPRIHYLNSTAHGDFSQSLFTITVSIRNVPCRLLIDSGASCNFISTTFAKQHKLRFSTFTPAICIRLADGTLYHSNQHLSSASVQLTANYSYTADFVATKLEAYDGILGKPFLNSVNPVIDWPRNTITSPFNLTGDAFALPSATIHLVSAKRLAKSIRQEPDMPVFRCFVTETLAEAPDPPPPPDSFAPTTVLSPANERALHHLLGTTHRATFDEPSTVTHAGPEQRINLLPNAPPPESRLYRMSPAELEELQRQLQIYLEKGWIRPSVSEYGAPVLFARKADGSLRMCIDYRALNAQTIKDKYPLPRMDELFDHLHGAKYFTSLDLWSGYHQCRIHPDDVHKTAFKTRYGSYEFTVMPFGLTNAPAAFMRLMNNVLKTYLDKFVVVYLDDVLIYSKTEEEHLRHLQLVLDTLNAANLKVKISKCSFAQSSTKFLGYVVSDQGISVDSKKVSSITTWPLPTDLTSMRSFLGFTGFYRKFIRDYAKIAAPLTDLTKTTQPFPSPLPPAAIDAFNLLKAALLSAPVLTIPFTGPTAEFTLYTDASTIGVGAVLLQDQGNGLQPVCYESRKLIPAEQKYAVHELELLAIVHALKVFRHYLEGCQHFTVYTDHHSLKYFFTQKNLSRRQAHWAQELAPYQPNMSITYRKGADNQADALSRLNTASLFTSSAASSALSLTSYNAMISALSTHFPTTASATLSTATPVAHVHSVTTDDSIVSTITTNFPTSASLAPAEVLLDDSILEDITTAYSSDPFYSAANTKRPKYLVQRDSLWYFNDRICVPKDPAIRLRLLQEHHDIPIAGHQGYLKTLNSIASQFWWPRMTRTVRSYVASCATCQRIKHSTQALPGLLQPHAIPSRPFASISMDRIVALPRSLCHDTLTYDSIISFTCMLTKYAIFVRARNDITSEQLAYLFIDNVMSKYGLPQVIVSDRDPLITSTFWQTLFNALGSKLNLSTAHHPQTDGQSERSHQSIEQILRAYVTPLHDDWSTWLPIAEYAYNTHVHASTHQTPFFATHGYNPVTPASLLHRAANTPPAVSDYLDNLRDIHATISKELELAKAQQTEQANRHRRSLSFKVGDRVRLSSEHITLAQYPSSKFRPRFLGPFPVTAIISPVSYRLQLPASMSLIHPVFHVSRLLPWTDNDDNEFPGRDIPNQPIQDAREYIHGDNVYEVHSITDCRIATDPASRARPKASVLFFRVKWAAPYDADDEDTWQSLHTISKTAALKEFLATPTWQEFTVTDAYKSFRRKFPSKVPKVVQFAV